MHPTTRERTEGLLPSDSNLQHERANIGHMQPKRQGWFDKNISRRNLSLTHSSSPSFFGAPVQRLVTYSPSKVPFLEQTLPGGSVGAFTDPWIWAISLSCCVVAILICVFTPKETSDRVNEQLEIVQQIADATSTLVAFLVGRFVTQVVAAWNQRRASYSAMCNGMRNLLLILSSCVSVSAGQLVDGNVEVVRRSRKVLGRYVMLASELAVLKSRGHLDTNRGRQHLENLGLLEPCEWDAMVQGDRHTSVLCWINAGCIDLQRRGTLDSVHVETIAKAVTAARTLSNDLMSSNSRDLPIPYTNLVAWLVRMAVLLQTIVFGLTMHQMTDPSSKVYATLGVFLYAYFFHAFIGIHRVLHNPFLDRLIDVTHERTISEGLKRLAEELMRDTAFLPPNWLGSAAPAGEGE